IAADWVLTSQTGWSTFTAAAGDAAAKAPGVEQVTSIRSDRGLIGRTQVNVNAVDPRTVHGLYRFDWRGGASDATLARLDDHGALVKQTFAKKHHLAVGDRFVLRAPDGRPLALRVL